MKLNEAQRYYWASTLRLTGGLLCVWLLVTVGVIWFADELNAINLIGPLGYYMGAQGSLIIFLAIIAIYARQMQRLDDALEKTGSEQSTDPGSR